MRFSNSFTAALVIAAFAVAFAPAQSFAETMIDGELGYDKGLYYRSADGRFKIKQNLRIQFRTEISSTNEDDSDTETDLMVRRVKMKYGGHAYEKWIKYGLQLTASVGRDTRDENLQVEDAFLVFAKNPVADLKVGRYKIPYARESLNSSSSLQFVDRSIANLFVIGQSRADGFSVGGVAGGMFSYRGGLFQFDDENFKGGDNILFAARVQANICCGELKYSSGSFTSGGDYKISPNFATVPTFAVGIGGFYYNAEETERTHNDSGTEPFTRDLDLNSLSGITVDLIAKYERANLEAAFYYGSTKRERQRGEVVGARDDDVNGETDDTLSLGTYSNGNWAYRVQGGFFLTPEFEVATRWAQANYDSDSVENDTWEWTTGLNYYMAKHRAKFQVDYTYRSEDAGRDNGGDLNENTFRAQVEFNL